MVLSQDLSTIPQCCAKNGLLVQIRCIRYLLARVALSQVWSSQPSGTGQESSYDEGRELEVRRKFCTSVQKCVPVLQQSICIATLPKLPPHRCPPCPLSVEASGAQHLFRRISTASHRVEKHRLRLSLVGR